MTKIRLWDAPLRVFHWSLVALVLSAFATGLIGGGLMDWHGRMGALILALLGFRLVWGVVGSTYARFAHFIKGPGTILAYLKGQWHGIGHNPLGALSVLGMLGVLLLQAVTGLMANDDIAFQGPYNILVSKETEALAVYIHKHLFWLVGLLVALHLGAIVFYSRVKGDNLVKPMIYGDKDVADTPGQPVPPNAQGGGPIALVIALLFALLVGWVAWGGPVKYLAPPPPPAADTPNW